MADFSELLRAPAGEAKRPPPLPVGQYQAIIKTWEVDNKNAKQTPYVRMHIGLIAFPDDVAPEDRMHEGKAIDLSKRQFRRDFYFGDALWRLDKFIRTCNIQAAGRSYQEVLPELIGKQVTATVEHYLNERSGEIGNQIGDLVGELPDAE